MPQATTQVLTKRNWRARLRSSGVHWVAIVLVFISLGYGGTVTLLHTEALSPVDEWVYVDYLYKMPSQGIVHEGEVVGNETLSILACHGTSPFGKIGPPCAHTFKDTSKFPNKGLSSAAAYTPIYFGITRIVGDGIHWLTGIDELSSWRLTGSLWLALSMMVFYLLLRQWRVRSHAILALGLAFIASPFAWWTFTYVSTDAPSFVLGGLLLYLAVAYVRGQRSGWWLPLVSVLAVLIKVTNLLAIWLIGFYLVVQLIREARDTHWSGWRTTRPISQKRYSLSLLGFPILSMGLAAAAELGWLRLVGLWAVSGLRADQGVSSALTPQELLNQVTNFLPGAIVYSPISSFVPGFVFTPLTWLCVAGVVGAFFRMKIKDRSSSVVIPVLIAAVAFAPLLAITLQIITGSYFQLPSRYGAPLIAAFLLLGGLILRGRVGSWAVGGYAAALLVVGVWLSAALATVA